MRLSIFAVAMLVKLAERTKGQWYIAPDGSLRQRDTEYCPLTAVARQKGYASWSNATMAPECEMQENVAATFGITADDVTTIVAAADRPYEPDGIALRRMLAPETFDNPPSEDVTVVVTLPDNYVQAPTIPNVFAWDDFYVARNVAHNLKGFPAAVVVPYGDAFAVRVRPDGPYLAAVMPDNDPHVTR